MPCSRSQLQVQRGASTADRMNQVISQIQAQRDECPEDTWNPNVIDAPATTDADFCFDAGTSTPSGGVLLTGGTRGLVGDTQVPASLRHGNTMGPDTGVGGEVRALSGRDSENNIIVYWDTDRASRPTDAAKCWLYVSRLRTWDENY